MKTLFVFILAMILSLGAFAQRISDLPKAQQPALKKSTTPTTTQSNPATKPAQNSSGDSIVFVKTVYDYGTIAQGSNGGCEFTFINKGKSPLILNDVKASCGCTIPQWPKEPIAPGKSGIIKVSYNTNLTGSFNKSITVNSNAVNTTVMLQIKGNVSPKPTTQTAQTTPITPAAPAAPAVTPATKSALTGSGDSIVFVKTVYDYGTIAQGSDGGCEFTFINKGKSPLILNDVRASCGCTIPQWPKEPIAPGKSGIIKVSYNTNLPGSFNKSITVTSNAVNTTMMLQIKGNVTPKATSSN